MLRRPAAWNLAWLFIVAFNAGCTDNPLPEASEAEAGALPGVPTSTGLTALPIGYAGPEHFMTEQWHNGTYSVSDSAWPLGGPINMVLQDQRAERAFDISDDLPPGVPAMVMVELHSSTRGGDPAQSGNVNVGMNANQMDFITADWSGTYGGDKQVHYTVQRLSGEPIHVIVFYGRIDPSVEVTYSLHITIMGSANVVPAGAVVGLKLAPNDLLVLEPLGELPEVSVFDPMDNHVDRWDVPNRTEVRIPQTAPEGEFILVTKQGAGALRVSAIRNDTTELRPIGFEWVGGVQKQIPTSGVTWEEDVNRPIVATGLWIHSNDQPFRCNVVEGSVMGPRDDEILAFGFEDVGCAGAGPFGWGIWSQTENGLSAVSEGTYTMHVNAPESVGMVAEQHYLHYLR